jgi:hypothetical protein
MEAIEVKNRSSPYRMRPNLYPSKARDQLVLTQLHTGGRLGFTRRIRTKRKIVFIYVIKYCLTSERWVRNTRYNVI